MKKLALMSDLHVDVNDFTDFEIETLIQVLKEEGISHLHLAGDTANDFDQIAKPFFKSLEKVVSLTYNLGNHDMLGMSEERIREKEARVWNLGPKQLVSLAGWYDYGFNAKLSQEQHEANKNFYWFDRKLERRGTDPQLTAFSLQKLEQVLAQTTKPLIVAMHFVPHQAFVPDYPYFQRFSAFLGSPAYHTFFCQHGIKEVVFGHLHHRHDRFIDGVHYQARPLGYQREWQLVRDFFDQYPEYLTEPSYHLSKRYRAIRDLPEFRDFYESHLAAEFRAALTIFDI